MAAARILRAFLETNRRLAVAVLAAAVVSGLLVPAFALGTGALVRDIRGGTSVTAPLVLLFAVFVIGRVLDPARELLGEALWRQSDEWLSQRLMRSMSAPPGIAHAESPEVRDRIAQTEGLVTGVTPGEAGWWLGPVVLLWVQGAGSLVIVAVYRWWIALALVAGYTLAYRVSRRHWHDVTLVLMGRTPRLRRSYYLRTLALTPQAAKETRVFGLADWLVERYRQGWLAEMHEIWRTRREGWLASVT
jgi:ATP-binding cassette, subfamily B, bacterial